LAAIAWSDDVRDHCGEQRKEDYDQNGFHTSSLWGSVGAVISSAFGLRVERRACGTPSSRVLPSVICSIGWSKRAIHRHPLSSQGPEQIIAPPGDEPSNPMQQRKARVGNLAIQVRAVDGQQHCRCHGYPKPSHPRFLKSERKLVKVTTC
jgi:hypothetical protein